MCRRQCTRLLDAYEEAVSARRQRGQPVAHVLHAMPPSHPPRTELCEALELARAPSFKLENMAQGFSRCFEVFDPDSVRRLQCR